MTTEPRFALVDTNDIEAFAEVLWTYLPDDLGPDSDTPRDNVLADIVKALRLSLEHFVEDTAPSRLHPIHRQRRRAARRLLGRLQAGKEDRAMTAEGVCDDCGQDYPTPWYAPNDLWNRIVGSPNGCLCPNCFMARGEAVIELPIWTVALDA